MIKLPVRNDRNISEDEYDLLNKIELYFNKEYILSVYADINGYSIIILGRVREENNRNYIIYYSQHNGKMYSQKMLDELIYLKSYFKSFLGVYSVNNSVLKLLINKNIGKEKYNAIDFKIEEIESYLLSIELLVGLDKLRIHPLVSELATHYQDFNVTIKSYPIYALMLPFVEYNEKNLTFWFGCTAKLNEEIVRDYYHNRGYY